MLLPARVRTVQPCMAHVIWGAAAGTLLRFTDSELRGRVHGKLHRINGDLPSSCMHAACLTLAAARLNDLLCLV